MLIKEKIKELNMSNTYTPSSPSTWRRWTFEAVDIHSDDANFGNKKWSIVSALLNDVSHV